MNHGVPELNATSIGMAKVLCLFFMQCLLRKLFFYIQVLLLIILTMNTLTEHFKPV